MARKMTVKNRGGRPQKRYAALQAPGLIALVAAAAVFLGIASFQPPKIESRPLPNLPGVAKPSTAAVLSAQEAKPPVKPDNVFRPAPGDVINLPRSEALAPVFYKISTAKPVIFVGIDDGWIKAPETADWLTNHRLPFSLFLTDEAIKNNYDYFKPLQAAGLTIQNHTIRHPNMRRLNFEAQKNQICAPADQYTTVFGHRPTLFRPPYGEYNDLTRQAVTECGLEAIIMWSVVVAGGVLQYQNTDHLSPGDIVLLHFNRNLVKDADALMAQAAKDGLEIGKLEDWLK